MFVLYVKAVDLSVYLLFIFNKLCFQCTSVVRYGEVPSRAKDPAKRAGCDIIVRRMTVSIPVELMRVSESKILKWLVFARALQSLVPLDNWT